MNNEFFDNSNEWEDTNYGRGWKATINKMTIVVMRDTFQIKLNTDGIIAVVQEKGTMQYLSNLIYGIRMSDPELVSAFLES